jgi:hypothetical protein
MKKNILALCALLLTVGINPAARADNPKTNGGSTDPGTGGGNNTDGNTELESRTIGNSGNISGRIKSDDSLGRTVDDLRTPEPPPPVPAIPSTGSGTTTR